MYRITLKDRENLSGPTFFYVVISLEINYKIHFAE